MKKIMNKPEEYTDDMLKGIYVSHGSSVMCVGSNLRCYCTRKRQEGKVAIITGGGTGHLPLFLGYVGEGMLDGCAVGDVFQSPSVKCIYDLSKEVDTGTGILYLYGNYTGDVMNFDMAAELCEIDGIQVKSITGADDVLSAPADAKDRRRGIAGIFFMYKCAGARAAQGGSLQDVWEAAAKAKENTRTAGFAFSPCIIPEVGEPNFTLNEGQMAMGMGIHGEPGIWTGPMKSSRQIAVEAVEAILNDMPIAAGEETVILVNGLGATSMEELYILAGDVIGTLSGHGVKVYRSFVGEFATSMEMAGASVSICRIPDAEMKQQIDAPVNTPFYVQGIEVGR